MKLGPAVCLLVGLMALMAPACSGEQLPSAAGKPLFTYEELMIPTRDGIKLQTVILRPVGRSTPLPILLRRSPYGVPGSAPDSMPHDLSALYRDGYIFVLQNVRGRFKSEGVFAVSTLVDVNDPKAVNDATDAYDTIDWLLKNIPANNGRVGVYGVSYGGLTAGLAMLYPHPELQAVSVQGASADQWMNDDFHRYGALRLSYAFEYAVLSQSDRNANSRFKFDTHDVYDWYLKLGPLSNVNDRYLHGTLSFWNDVVDHPDYDEYWKRDAWVRQLRGTSIPLLTVAGFWDQEDPWGPWEIFRRSEGDRPNPDNFMVAGPWSHGAWARAPKGDTIGRIPLGGHETSREYREEIEAPFFRYFLHGTGARPQWKVKTFQTGANQWRMYSDWPPKGVELRNLYLHADGTLSFKAPTEQAQSDSFREYVSDPENPVPYRRRPISPLAVGHDWSTWEVSDQRFVDHRPDVLAHVSAPLERNLAVTERLRLTYTPPHPARIATSSSS